MILIFDLVESWLIQENKEWYELGEHQVDFLIPMPYKTQRLVLRQACGVAYHSQSTFLVDNAIPLT